jgi:uncharacterized membrane protein
LFSEKGGKVRRKFSMLRTYPAKIRLMMGMALLKAPLVAHEGHHELMAEQTLVGSGSDLMLQVGNLHLFLLHFPIALIVMTVVAELLFVLFRRSIYDYAARFMLLSAAIFAVPTAFAGLLLRYSSTYEGILAIYIWWHMIAGIATMLLTLYVAYLRERVGLGRYYYLALALLFLLVNVTGLLGGWVAF